MSITKDNVDEKNLSELPYGKLKETFTDLGVESAWKPGTKAKVMIKNALDKLGIIKKMDITTESKEEIEKTVEEIQVKEAEAVEIKKKKVISDQLKADINEQIKKDKGLLPREEIEQRIERAYKNLKKCLHTHVSFYNKRIKVYEAMLKNNQHLQ
jgi:hypothetical protein